MSARIRLAPASSVLVLAASMMLGTTARLSASPIETPFTYSTYGSVDSFGVDGPPILVYQGVPYATATTAGSFDIGGFTVAGSESSTYSNVPVHIAFRIQSIDGAYPSVNQTPVNIEAFLSASIVNGEIKSLSVAIPPFGTTPEDVLPYPTSVTPFGSATTTVISRSPAGPTDRSTPCSTSSRSPSRRRC